MSVTYQIDVERERVTTILRGNLKMEMCIQHHRKLAVDPQFDPGFDELMDGSAVVDVDLNSRAVFSLSESCPFGPLARRAVYCGDNMLRFGLARMFQTLAGGRHGEIQVFRNVEDAICWLDKAVRAQKTHGSEVV